MDPWQQNGHRARAWELDLKMDREKEPGYRKPPSLWVDKTDQKSLKCVACDERFVVNESGFVFSIFDEDKEYPICYKCSEKGLNEVWRLSEERMKKTRKKKDKEFYNMMYSLDDANEWDRYVSKWKWELMEYRRTHPRRRKKDED